MIERRRLTLHKHWNGLLALGAALLLLPFFNALTAYYADRDALLVTYLIIGLTVFIVLVKVPDESKDKMFLLALACVSLSLFFVYEFASPYVLTADMQLELYVFGQVLTNNRWHAAFAGAKTAVFNTALSITVLPVILNIESSISGTLIFKFLFPILYSMFPLILYRVYRQFLDPSAALLSGLIVVMDPTFYGEMLQLGRQMIAEIFLALLLLMAVSKRKQSKTLSGMLLILIFSFGIIVAHYTIAFILLLLMLSSFLLSTFSKRVETLWGSGILLAWLVLLLTWFLLLTGGAVMLNLATNVSEVWTGITNDLLNPASRPMIVQTALFLNSPTPGILHVISRFSQYAAVASILIGFLALLRKKKKSTAERQLMPLIAISFGMLVATVGIPIFGAVLNFSRFFHLALIFIAPCAFFGVQWLISELRRVIPHRIRVRPFGPRVPLAALIFLYFIFTSGWVWAVTRDPYPTSISIDWQRMKDSTNLSFVEYYYTSYDSPEDVVAAYWLSHFGSPTQPVCADFSSTYQVLASYGQRDPYNGNLAYVLEFGNCQFAQNEYIYFSEFNGLYRAYGIGSPISIYQISSRVAKSNRVYSGGATVYYS